MARIIKLGELLPEDFTIELPGGQQYTLPGDPPLELILRIAELFERSQDGEEDEGVGLEVLADLDAQMLKLLRMRDESVTSSPFGVLGVQHVVGALLDAYNFGEAEGSSEEEDPPKPASRSKRSSGSRSSSTSSASSRTTGAGSAGRSSKRSSA